MVPPSNLFSSNLFFIEKNPYVHSNNKEKNVFICRAPLFTSKYIT